MFGPEYFELSDAECEAEIDRLKETERRKKEREKIIDWSHLTTEQLDQLS